MKIICRDCQKTPAEILEYQMMVEDEGYRNADEAVMLNEGTYNPMTGQFLCTECYINAGMPLGIVQPKGE